MDKIIISSEDVNSLFEWRDNNIDLVMRCPCPLKAIEIHFSPDGQVETGFYLRCIREKPQLLRLYIGAEGAKANGYFLLERMFDGRWLKIKDTIDGDETSFKPSKKEFGDSLVAVYATLMALMVYGRYDQPQLPEEVEYKERKPSAAMGKKTPKKTKSATYILHNTNGTVFIGRQGSHASPNGIFSVRGHWRHYKSGKIVWIAEYKKGDGHKKSKTYRIGGNVNGVPKT